MKKALIWLGLGVLLITGVGCQEQQQSSYTGIIEGEEVSIRTEVAGIVKEISKKQGEQVTTDEKVAQLNDDLYKLQVDEAQAVVDGARAKLEEIQEQGTEQSIQQAEAYLKQVESKLAQVKLQQSKTAVYSSGKGIVLRSYVEKGEVVQAGTSLYTVLNKESLELVIYIPVSKLNEVEIGKQVAVTVDTYPEREFMGEIINITNEAEFTPKNVQTSDDRTKMVFAVTVKLNEGFDVLKPGMPADVNL